MTDATGIVRDRKPTGRRSSGARPIGPFTATSLRSAVVHPWLAAMAAIAVIVIGSSMGFHASETWATVFIILGLLLAVIIAHAFAGRRWRHPLRAARMDAIARRAGLAYRSDAALTDDLRAALGTSGSARVQRSMVSPDGDLLLGTLTTMTPNGFRQDWGILAVRLARRVPNIVLRSEASRSSAGEPFIAEAPHRGQTLSLEGDFDRHFTLYCPAGYERDALYVFTPDLMALLIDEAGDLSVQFVDEQMIFTCPAPFDLTDEALVHRLLSIANVVGAKAASRTIRYRDSRSDEDDVVAEGGRRVARPRPNWPTLVWWYSVRALAGAVIAVLVIASRLGLDPGQWADASRAIWG